MMRPPSLPHVRTRRCCGRLIMATWNAEGEGIWKCRRCGRTYGKRGSMSNLPRRDVARHLRQAQDDASLSSTAGPTRFL